MAVLLSGDRHAPRRPAIRSGFALRAEEQAKTRSTESHGNASRRWSRRQKRGAGVLPLPSSSVLSRRVAIAWVGVRPAGEPVDLLRARPLIHGLLKKVNIKASTEHKPLKTVRRRSRWRGVTGLDGSPGLGSAYRLHLHPPTEDRAGSCPASVSATGQGCHRLER